MPLDELQDPINRKVAAGEPLTSEEADVYLADLTMSDRDREMIRKCIMSTGYHITRFRRGSPPAPKGSPFYRGPDREKPKVKACGEPKKDGTPCKRPVKGGGPCEQHFDQWADRKIAERNANPDGTP